MHCTTKELWYFNSEFGGKDENYSCRNYFREYDWRNNSSYSSGSLRIFFYNVFAKFHSFLCDLTFIWFPVSLLILYYCYLNKLSLWLGFFLIAWLPFTATKMYKVDTSIEIAFNSILYSHLSGHGEQAGRPHLVYTVHWLMAELKTQFHSWILYRYRYHSMFICSSKKKEGKKKSWSLT